MKHTKDKKLTLTPRENMTPERKDMYIYSLAGLLSKSGKFVYRGVVKGGYVRLAYLIHNSRTIIMTPAPELNT
jgi:hypothetical protein